MRFHLAIILLTFDQLKPALSGHATRKTYIHSPERMNWFQAETWCEGRDATLVEIDSYNENQQLLRYLQNVPYITDEKHFWINLNDLAQEGTFHWGLRRHIPNWTNWWRGEPNNKRSSRGDEDCVHIWKVDDNYHWNDINCNVDWSHALCEKWEGVTS